MSTWVWTEAPWTVHEVALLVRHQIDGNIHPYTCGRCRDDLGIIDEHGDLDDRLLIPMPDGFYCPTCPGDMAEPVQTSALLPPRRP